MVESVLHQRMRSVAWFNGPAIGGHAQTPAVVRLLNVEQSQDVLRRLGQGGQNIDCLSGEVAALLGTIATSYAPAVIQYGLSTGLVFENDQVALEEG